MIEEFQIEIMNFNIYELEKNKNQLIDKVKILKTKLNETIYLIILKNWLQPYRKCEAELSSI